MSAVSATVWKVRSEQALPPGPKFMLPHHFFYEPDVYLAKCARRYGDPMMIRSAFGRDVVLGSPETVKALFSADPDTFDVALKEIGAPLFGDESLILQSGPRHRNERKLLAPPFHGERMRTYGEIMKEITLRQLGRVPLGRPFAALDLTQEISLEIILQAVFGITEGAQIDAMRRAIVTFVRSFSPLLVFFPALRREIFGLSPWARFRRAREALDGLLFQQIDARSAGAPGEDILSLLLSARYDDGMAFSREQVRDQLLTLLFAGHETTAISLAWALRYLAQHPAVAGRLVGELRALGADATAEELAANQLLGAVCYETLRLRPLLPVLPIRRLVRPFAVGRYTLPPGLGVSACPALLHRRPELYPDPDRFWPERFLGRSPGPFEFLAFGGGSRRCLGAAFALQEMKIVLGTALLHRRLRLCHPERPVREVRRNLTMGPLGGIPMIAEAV